MRNQAKTVLAIGVLAGCMDIAAPEPELATIQQDIQVGTNDTSDPTRNAVVLVGGGCTGTLIAPNIVVTAAHCGWSDNSFATGGWTAISPLTIAFGPSRTTPIATATADAVSVPPLATAGPWPVDDIALLRLTTSVAPSVAVPRPAYLDRPVTLTGSSTIYQVGYGGGRNRRYMTGSGYHDWLAADTTLMNGFFYTAANHGDGIGDRGTNIEGGDSGGPMLLASPTGFVIGDLSWWDPYGIATFGPGGEGRPDIRDWLNAKAPQKPELAVVAIAAAACTATGTPQVRVTVKNAGARTTSAWVDVFHDLAGAPTVGTLSTLFNSSGTLAPEQTIDLYFAIPAAAGGHWIDVIVDTTRSVDELNEANNVSSAFVTLVDCTLF